MTAITWQHLTNPCQTFGCFQTCIMKRQEWKAITDTREFEQRRFWVTHIDRTWGVFPFNISWNCQIRNAECLWDDLPKNVSETTAEVLQKTRFQLTRVAQKLLCLNSLFNQRSLTQLYLYRLLEKQSFKKSRSYIAKLSAVQLLPVWWSV